MDYIVSVSYEDKPGHWSKEYVEYMDLEEAKQYADRRYKELMDSGVEYSVSIYEITGY